MDAPPDRVSVTLRGRLPEHVLFQWTQFVHWHEQRLAYDGASGPVCSDVCSEAPAGEAEEH